MVNWWLLSRNRRHASENRRHASENMVKNKRKNKQITTEIFNTGNIVSPT